MAKLVYPKDAPFPVDVPGVASDVQPGDTVEVADEDVARSLIDQGWIPDRKSSRASTQEGA